MDENNELNSILSSNNYLTPSRYISGRIVEYDIKSANISTLRELNIISDDQYTRLSKLPKNDREIEIGLMIRQDESIYQNIQKGIKSAKLALGKANNINPFSIVRIANDAVYINSNIDLQYTRFGNYIEFKQKSIYNIMLVLDKLIIFLSFLPNGSFDIDVKGISQEKLILHENYMLSLICSTIVLKERTGTLSAINYLSNICEDYLHYNLPVQYYREFNSDSLYRINYSIPTISESISFYPSVMEVSENDKHCIDINYNYFLLRELWSILIEFYNMKR